MKDAARRKIEELVERFNCNIDVYKSGSYNEAQTRREFIEPFFESLGWDVYNRQGYAEQYKDVVHEDSVKVGVSLKAPDYSFRIGGQRKFFLEAKKPSVSIKDDIDPSYQLRRYAWSAKLPLSILTDFEELAVYDCRIKPSPRDRVGTRRIAYYTYKRYIDEFDAVYDVFSRDSVLKGSFDRYAVTTAGKRGTAEVDREFLKEIEGWRDSLARNIAVRNPKLTVDEMNFAVQQTIDRLIFLRICEDRGIEQYGSLQALLNGVNTYRRLFELFYQADTKYNSGLFDFSADKLTPDIKIGDDVLKGIIDGLYYPKSPYEFSVLGVDILGNVYEQFLGKVIRLTAGHNAKVEEKPEVKKAGGVYYTPEYIVEYIVQNTVGKLVEGKTPKKAEELKILDPACGSGSFLIGAYQYLLSYHLKWYIENSPDKYAKGKFPAVYRSGEGWRLTTQEKKRILLNNIFGVDIDRQAVEVTKLSLLLKVLEDENRETIGKNLLLFRERVLPNLDSNIKCGNSLIGPDFYDSAQPSFTPLWQRGDGGILQDDEIRRINPFDWHDPEKGFGTIIKEGGFDVVIGNPPYRSLLIGKKQKSEDVEVINYYKKVLPYVAEYKMNLFGFFIEKCPNLLKAHGFFSFIIPNLLYTSYYFKNLRQFLLGRGRFIRILDLRYKVFDRAEIGGNGIFIFTPDKKIKKTIINIANSSQDFETPQEFSVNSSDIAKNPEFVFFSEPSVTNVLGKISQVSCIELGKICTIYQGIITGNNEKFLSERPGGSKWEKIIRGRDINLYRLEFGGFYVFYDPNELWSNTNPAMFRVSEKLISRQTSDHLIATLDTNEYFTLDSTHVIHLKDPIFSLKYLLGIYNSRLLNYLYKNRVRESGRVFAQVKVVNLKPLPIRTIDFKNPKEKSLHDKMVSLVDRMLDLNKKLQSARIAHDRELLERQIKITDEQIDRLVYELYGLTEEERRIVEGTNA